MTAIIYGAPEGYDALLLARRRAEHTGSLVHVARDDSRLARLSEALAVFAPDVELLRFPAWDCLPYDRVSPNAEIVSERIATLARLIEPATRPRILLTTVNALVQRVPPRDAFRGAAMTLRQGRDAPLEAIITFLEANGYNRAGTVMEPGEYATRGGILDLFPAGEPEPVRLDLFGDTIESLRRFDPTTQRSSAKLTELVLRPVSEVPHDKAGITRFREAWRDLFGPGAAKRPPLPIRLRRPPLPRHRALGAPLPSHHGDPARLHRKRLRQPRPPIHRGPRRPHRNDRRPRGSPPHPRPRR